MIGVPITSEQINAEKWRRAALNDIHDLAALGMVRIQELLAAREAEGKPLTPEELRDLAEALYSYWEIFEQTKGVQI
jgi:hypothetical protein